MQRWHDWGGWQADDKDEHGFYDSSYFCGGPCSMKVCQVIWDALRLGYPRWLRHTSLLTFAKQTTYSPYLIACTPTYTAEENFWPRETSTLSVQLRTYIHTCMLLFVLYPIPCAWLIRNAIWSGLVAWPGLACWLTCPTASKQYKYYSEIHIHHPSILS